MDHAKFIICYEGSPLVIVENHEFQLPSEVLAWYAKHYAFERSKLTWAYIHTVKME